MAKPLSCWFFSEKTKHEKKYLHCFSTWNGRRMLKLTFIENKSIQIANIIADFQWISMSFRTHPCVLAFITHVLFKTEFSWLFSGEFDIHLLYIFQIRNSRHCVDEFWWTCHLKRRYMVIVWGTVLLLCCYDCGNTQQYHDVTRFECVLWRRKIREWVMNIDYQT